MTFFQAQATLKRISYKPEFRFTLNPIHENDYSSKDKRQRIGATLSIYANFPDSVPERRGQRADVIYAQTVSSELLANYDEVRFLKWVREAVLSFEIHERDEWFRLDGKLVYNPHGPEDDRLRGL